LSSASLAFATEASIKTKSGTAQKANFCAILDNLTWQALEIIVPSLPLIYESGS
jgi:hypothetical protein